MAFPKISLESVRAVTATIPGGNTGANSTMGLPSRWPLSQSWKLAEGLPTGQAASQVCATIESLLKDVEEAFDQLLSSAAEGLDEEKTQDACDLLGEVAEIQDMVYRPAGKCRLETFPYFRRYFALHFCLYQVCWSAGGESVQLQFAMWAEETLRFLREARHAVALCQAEKICIRRAWPDQRVAYVIDADSEAVLTRPFDSLDEAMELDAILAAIREAATAGKAARMGLDAQWSFVAEVLGPVQQQTKAVPLEIPWVSAIKEEDLSPEGRCVCALPSEPGERVTVGQVLTVTDTLHDIVQIVVSEIPIVGPTINFAYNLIKKLVEPQPEDAWGKFRDELMAYVDLKLEDTVAEGIASQLSGNADGYNSFMAAYENLNNPGALEEGHSLYPRATGYIDNAIRTTGHILTRKPEASVAPNFAEMAVQHTAALLLMTKLPPTTYNFNYELQRFYDRVADWFVKTVPVLYTNRFIRVEEEKADDFWGARRVLRCKYCQGFLTDKWSVTGWYPSLPAGSHNAAADDGWRKFMEYAKVKAGLGALVHRLVLPGAYAAVIKIEESLSKHGVVLKTIPYNGISHNGVKAFFDCFMKVHLDIVVAAQKVWEPRKPKPPLFHSAALDSLYCWSLASEGNSAFYMDQAYVVRELKNGKNWWITPTHRDASAGLPKYPLK